MSDFLTRLAQRAIGQAPLVKPSVRPMYAPADLAVMSPGEEGWSEFVDEHESPRQHRRIPAEQRVHHRAAPAAQPPMPLPRGQAVASRDKTALVPPRPSIPSPDPAVAAPERAAPPSPLPIQAAEQVAIAAPAFHLGVAQLIRDESPIERQSRVPLTPRSMEQDAVVAHRNLAEDASGRRPDRHRLGTSPLPSSLSREARLRPAIAPPTDGHQSLSSPLAPFDTAPSAPTIRVTIGRIEVRGAAMPNPPAPARPKRPTLSLGDYLKERDGGNR